MTSAIAGRAAAGAAAGKVAPAGSSVPKTGAADAGVLSFGAGDVDPVADPRDENSSAPPKKAPAKKAAAKKAPAKKATTSTRSTSTSSKKKPAKKAAAKKTPGSAAATKARRSVDKAARRATAPARREGQQALRLLAAAVGLSVLYLLLTNADTVAPLLGGVGKALKWLRDPVPIPYRN